MKKNNSPLHKKPSFTIRVGLMRWKVFILLFCSLLVVGAGCKRRETPKPVPKTSSEPGSAQGDVCHLITSEEIGAIQGSPVTEPKGSTRSENGFRVSQCFYTTTEFSKSVNLALVQRDPGYASTRSVRDFWKEKFDPYENEEPQKDSDREKEKGPPPKRIAGMGDEAYWASNRFGGTLYVLKGDAFISVALGGTDGEDIKLKKSKTLVQKALQRL